MNGDIYAISSKGGEHTLILGMQAESDDAPEILFSCQQEEADASGRD
ncbi:hypothetical protein [Rhizobium leguminosarum]